MNEKDIDIIENYLAGTLSVEDKQEVEARMLTDQEFAQRVEILKSLPHLVDESSLDFRNELEGIYQEYQQKQKPSRTLPPRTYWIAASLALLLSVIGLLIWLLPTSLTSQEIYAANFTMPADNITVRNDQSVASALQSAMEAYNVQDYTTAITHFEDFLQGESAHVPALFYSGVSYLALAEVGKAIQNLQKVTQIQDPTYAISAQWYLGLAYLKQNNTEQARKIFSSLKESGSSYASKADTVLQQLADK